MSLWDLLDPDIQRYIRCIASVVSVRDRWRGYSNKVTTDILELTKSTREIFNPFTTDHGLVNFEGIVEQAAAAGFTVDHGLVHFEGIEIDTERTRVELYGMDAFHTLEVIKFIKNHHYPIIDKCGEKIWMEWLNDLSFSLWENEWGNLGGQAVLYNMIYNESKEFFKNKLWHNKKFALFPHLEPRFDISFDPER